MTYTETVTILFTDVVGSTQLRTAQGDVSAHQILWKHFELVRQQIEDHSGQEVKTIGDSFMVAFDSARRAVDCAIALQRALAEHNRRNPAQQVHVRIGLNTGEVIREEGDLFGAAVDAAARILHEATGGQVLISEATRRVIGVAGDGEFVDKGLFNLKGFPEQWRLYEAIWEPQKTVVIASATSNGIPKEDTSPSIAILPFTNMSADKDQEYFCDGLAEELINVLTKLGGLRVASRTSAFSFKGERLDIQEIGRRLRVRTVLEGSVRKSGNRLRIAAQLVDTAHGRHLWSERYDSEMDDILAIQDEIAEAIVEKLRIELLGEKKTKLAKHRTVDPEAYNLYLKGRWFWNKMTEEGLKKSIEYFELAIERDFNYAPAYSGLAEAYAVLPHYSPFPPGEAYPKAREAALKALAIDDTIAEAHASLAVVKTHYEWDWEGAEKECKRAIELKPGYATAHHWYAHYLVYNARFEEAMNEIEAALRLDPLSLSINRCAGEIYYYCGKTPEAIGALNKTLEMDPRFGRTHALLGLVYLDMSMYEAALAELENERSLAGGWNPFLDIILGGAYILIGETDRARDILNHLIEQSKKSYVPPIPLALAAFLLGDKDRGFDWLEKAYEEREPWLSNLKVAPVFGRLGLRSDPRYIALLKKMNLDK